MSRNLALNGMVDKAGLRRWFKAEYDYSPGFYTISAAIRQGLPCEPHPLLEGKLLFDIEKVRIWIAERSRKKNHSGPLRAAMSS